MSNSCQENCQWLGEYLKTQLTAHPMQVNQTWAEHCLDALCYSGRAFAASTALLIHAFVPCWCQDWGSKQIDSLNTAIKTKCQAEQPIVFILEEKEPTTSEDL